MHFSMKNILKSNRNYTSKQVLNLEFYFIKVSAKEKIMLILVSEIKLMGFMDLLRNQCIEILSCIYFFTQ